MKKVVTRGGRVKPARRSLDISVLESLTVLAMLKQSKEDPSEAESEGNDFIAKNENNARQEQAK